MNSGQDAFLFNIRQAIGLSTTESAQLVHVTRRTWEMWESGARTIPTAKLELFISKISGDRPKLRETVVIIRRDENGMDYPIDAIAEDIFLSISEEGDGKATIKSLKIDRYTGRPYVHSTCFCIEHNTYVMRIIKKWEAALYD